MTDQLAWAIIIAGCVGFIVTITWSLGWKGVLGMLGLIGFSVLFAAALIQVTR